MREQQVADVGQLGAPARRDPPSARRCTSSARSRGWLAHRRSRPDTRRRRARSGWRSIGSCKALGRARRSERARSRDRRRGPSADSIPTERRTRFAGEANGASAVEACVHLSGHLDQALDAAELSASFQICVRATSAAASSALAARTRPFRRSRPSAGRELVSRMSREAGVEDAVDCRVAVEELGDRASVLAVLAHAERGVFSPRSNEQRVERPGTRRASSGERRAARRWSGRSCRRSRRRVRVAAEVLRRRVDDDVGAELERALKIWSRERVVDGDHCSRLPRGVGDRADVDEVQQRVRRGLQPDEPGALVDRLGDRVVRGELELVALRLVDLGEEPVRAAVDVVDGRRSARPARRGASGSSSRPCRTRMRSRTRRSPARPAGLECATVGWRCASSRNPCAPRPPPARRWRSGRSAR